MKRRESIKNLVISLASLYGFGLGNKIDANSIKYIEDSDWINNLGISKWYNPYTIKYTNQCKPNFSTPEFNIKKENRPIKIHWNTKDSSSPNWTPQGITGNSKCNIPEKKVGNKRILASSTFYKKNLKSRSRVSFFDITNFSESVYENVLFVANRCDETLLIDTKDYELKLKYAPVIMHAGGIAWYNNLLFVVHTHIGIRVFDLNKIFKVDNSKNNRNKCGYYLGKNYGLGHNYVLPQIGLYRLPNEYKPLSCLSLEQNSQGDKLWTSQYIKPGSKESPKMFGFKLDVNGRITNENAEIKTFNKSCGKSGLWRVQGIQGALKIQDELWLSSLESPDKYYLNSRGRLITQYKNNTGIRWRWPHGPEDLYYEKETDIVWSQTEFEPERYLFGVKRSTYKNVKEEPECK